MTDAIPNEGSLRLDLVSLDNNIQSPTRVLSSGKYEKGPAPDAIPNKGSMA